MGGLAQARRSRPTSPPPMARAPSEWYQSAGSRRPRPLSMSTESKRPVLVLLPLCDSCRAEQKCGCWLTSRTQAPWVIWVPLPLPSQGADSGERAPQHKRFAAWWVCAMDVTLAQGKRVDRGRVGLSGSCHCCSRPLGARRPQHFGGPSLPPGTSSFALTPESALSLLPPKRGSSRGPQGPSGVGLLPSLPPAGPRPTAHLPLGAGLPGSCPAPAGKRRWVRTPEHTRGAAPSPPEPGALLPFWAPRPSWSIPGEDTSLQGRSPGPQLQDPEAPSCSWVLPALVPGSPRLSLGAALPSPQGTR